MRIAVIGGGPAGSTAARQLAREGVETHLFDPSFDREKPCGGAVTDRALAHHPWLLASGLPHAEIRTVEFEAPSGRTAVVALPAPLRIFSRRLLDARIAEQARGEGARLRAEKVLAVLPRDGAGGGPGRSPGGQASPPGVLVRTAAGREELFDGLIGADGARSLVRATFARPFTVADLSQAAGYYIAGRTGGTARIVFREGLRGYAWSFPRHDHLAIGACGPLSAGGAADLQLVAGDLARKVCGEPAAGGGSFYSALVPTLTPAALSANEVCGPGWRLAGDAAGFVDPLTGEGISYAVESASLAAESLLRGKPEDYPAAWEGSHGAELLWAARRRERFFDPELTEKLVIYADASATVRRILADLVLGRQPYLTLKRRLLTRAVPTALRWALGRFLG